MTIAFPDWLEPMAATLTQERFTGPEWIFERKFDGIRLLAFKQGTDVRLFSRNRLNVAISRAQCLAYLVASPRLLELNARTVEQMRLANALCRFVELADPG